MNNHVSTLHGALSHSTPASARAALCIAAAICAIGAIAGTGCTHDTRAASSDTARGDRHPDSALTASGGGAATSTPSNAGGDSSRGPTRPTRYVGLQYDSLPGGFTYRDGAVLPQRPDRKGAEYDLTRLETPSGPMIWLDTLGAPVGRGLRARIVRAELPVPTLAADERFLLSSCDVGGKLDPWVVAVGIVDKGSSRLTKIRQAWRVNLGNGRFDSIPVAGIVCDEPGATG